MTAPTLVVGATGTGGIELAVGDPSDAAMRRALDGAAAAAP